MEGVMANAMPVSRFLEEVEDELGLDQKEDTAKYELDDLDNTEIQMLVEYLFDVTFPDDEAVNCKTVGDVVDWLKNKNLLV